MRIHVSAQDIAAGREDAGAQCGCPIWHALNRQLGLNLTEVDESVLGVMSYEHAEVKGKLRILLPQEAIEMQTVLNACPKAEVESFSFDARVEML